MHFLTAKKLVKINFPASLKEIGKDAFYWTEIGDCISKEWQAKKIHFILLSRNMRKSRKKRQAKQQECESH